MDESGESISEVEYSNRKTSAVSSTRRRIVTRQTKDAVWNTQDKGPNAAAGAAIQCLHVYQHQASLPPGTSYGYWTISATVHIGSTPLLSPAWAIKLALSRHPTTRLRTGAQAWIMPICSLKQALGTCQRRVFCIRRVSFARRFT